MRKGLQSLDLSFEDQTLTHFGGLFLIQRFCNKLGLRRRLQRMLRPTPSWVDFHPADLILILLYALIAGLPRIAKIDTLHYDGFFLSLLGLKRFPDQTSVRRFLHRLSTGLVRRTARVHDQLRRLMFDLPSPRTTLTFHIDSVVLTLYGRQQGARIGYNPRKKGRPSYHPILCFEAHGQEFWHGSLRPGDAASNTGARGFVQCCLRKIPSTVARSRVRVFADCGFFSGKLVNDLDQAGCGYTIVCRRAKDYVSMANSAGFKEMKFGWGVSEFWHQPQKWRKPHRFIVVRQPLPEDPQEAQQLTLFKSGRYSYSAYVTNLDLAAARVWRAYHGRGNVERSIRELLYHFALGKIPTHKWVANVAFMQLLVFAYDLVHWFKRLCLPQEYREATVETIREEFLLLPARLIKHGSRNVLQLPKNYRHRKAFLEAAKKIESMRFPGPDDGEK
ncbi:MAG: IS1380 family transposase [Verrucomicrobia bacterium]|nr:IS1380 family transposase [Verrucomicrobiota bacterium]